MVTVLILGLVMGPMFFFLLQIQRRSQSNVVTSESNQGARAAMEAMAQEIGQAGFNPQVTSSTTSSDHVMPNNACPVCVNLGTTNGINPGDWVSVDSGGTFEQTEVLAVGSPSGTATLAPVYTTANYPHCASLCTPAANQISAVFNQCHNPSGTQIPPCPAGSYVSPFPIASFKTPFASGILQGQTVNYGGSSVSISNDHLLALYYGDKDNSGSLYYVVYSLYNPTSSGPPPSVTISGATYNLYTLYRSVTQMNYASGQTVSHAYPLVNNVLYRNISGATLVGPTGQPLFSYPATVQVTVVPSTVTVVGTVVINISVALNPQSLEAPGAVQYYTMASQIRPVNLWAAVTINQTGGAKYLPPMPAGLPMAFPTTISNYYF